VTSTTLWDYLSALYGLLQPVGERLAQHVLAQPVIGVDETSWRLLKSEQKGKSKVWWVWARRCDDAVHYTLDPSRSAETAKALLGTYSGTVLCDGYAAYESLARAGRRPDPAAARNSLTVRRSPTDFPRVGGSASAYE
jgi:transposase